LYHSVNTGSQFSLAQQPQIFSQIGSRGGRSSTIRVVSLQHFMTDMDTSIVCAALAENKSEPAPGHDKSADGQYNGAAWRRSFEPGCAKRGAVMTPGSLIRESRESHGLTQTQLAERVGVTPGFITKLEKNEALPGTELTLTLANLL